MAPADNFILEQALSAHLAAGEYDEALALGLPHLNMQNMSLPNLLLLVRAARLRAVSERTVHQKSDYRLAKDLLQLITAFYPSLPAIEIEDRLLKLAQGACMAALQPLSKTDLSNAQKQILGEISAQCPTQWQNHLQLSSWIGKPLRSASGISQITPETNSFIDQVCSVFSVGCGPVTIQNQQDRSVRVYIQADWHMRHLRRDRLYEDLRVQFQKNRSITTTSHASQVHMQYGWQIEKSGYTTQIGVSIALLDDVIKGGVSKNQMTRAGYLQVHVPVLRNLALISSMRLAVKQDDLGKEQRDITQASTLNWRVSPGWQFAIKTSQTSRRPSANNLRGPSAIIGQTASVSGRLFKGISLQMAVSKSNEAFSQTLYYLTKRHNISEQKQNLRLTIPFGPFRQANPKKVGHIWIGMEKITARSADPLYNFGDKTLTLGVSFTF